MEVFVLMPTPFLSSEEYDERAHQLYNEGSYDEALDVLREGLALYPNAVELHIGVGYARLAREEMPWARRSFEQALVLEPDHEDALAGLGETLLKVGQEDAALRCFNRIFELGYSYDLDLMLQVGRALFREASFRERAALFELALEFFEQAREQAPEMAEAIACVGYAQHRLNDDTRAIESLRAALQLDADHAEARIYLANILYDRSEYEGALYHFERTRPEDHWDELGIWRLIELKRSVYKLEENDAELTPWHARLAELGDELDDLDELLLQIDPGDGAIERDEGAAPGSARHQVEMFGALLSGLADREARDETRAHQVVGGDGASYEGSWEEIVTRMRDADGGGTAAASIEDYMKGRARHVFTETGIQLPSHDAESFLRASARAGLLRIVR
jgi:tetratricopeptide (TPR) repeat protein